MYFLFILVIVLFSVVFIFKDEKQQLLKNFSLFITALSLVLAVLLLGYSFPVGPGGTFLFLGIFDFEAANVQSALKMFVTISLISIMLHFYTLTRSDE